MRKKEIIDRLATELAFLNAAPEAPYFISPSVLGGNAPLNALTVGATLYGNAASAEGTPAPSVLVEYIDQNDTVRGSGSSYVIQQELQGQFVRLRTTATNSEGQVTDQTELYPVS